MMMVVDVVAVVVACEYVGWMMLSLLGIAGCFGRVPVGTEAAVEDNVEQGVQPLPH